MCTFFLTDFPLGFFRLGHVLVILIRYVGDARLAPFSAKVMLFKECPKKLKKTMEIQGLVTDINSEMLTFTIDGKTTVHTALLFLVNPSQKLPQKGTKISVESQFYKSNEFYTEILILCFDTEIQGDLSISCPQPNKFLQLIKTHALKGPELLIIDENYQKLKKYFQSIHQISNEEIILCTVAALLKGTQLSKFTLRFINQMGYVEPPSAFNIYKDLSYWTFGTHWDKTERPNRNYLIGFLYVHKQYGTVCFTDFKRPIACTIIFNSPEVDSLSILNKYVLIENYTILTEIYNNIQYFFPLEYLLVKSENIIVLPVDDTNFRQKIIVKQVPKNLINEKSFWCKIISKSVPMINQKGSKELWLEILEEDGNKMLLCLNSTYTEIFPLLKPNFCYKIFYKGPTLKKIFNSEIKKTIPLPQIELPNDAIFIPVCASTDLKQKQNHVMNVEEANRYLSTSNTNLISFQGTISTKKFVDPLSSRTVKLTKDPNFGTTGPKTHMLEFRVGVGTTVLTLYLNNFENLSIPYCLIPNMRIRVYNVHPQKGSYYKCTAMTSFEVLAYDQDFHVETANLKGGANSADWGGNCFLGAGDKIPIGVIIWGRITNCFILGLKIRYVCGNCSNITNFGENCRDCHDSNQRFTATITLITYDQKGESKVIAKDAGGILLLKLLLGVQEKVFEEWIQGFKILNSYEYSRGLLVQGEDFKTEAINSLTTHFDSISRFGMSLELKCRKINNERNGNSLYYLLDARK